MTALVFASSTDLLSDVLGWAVVALLLIALYVIGGVMFLPVRDACASLRVDPMARVTGAARTRLGAPLR